MVADGISSGSDSESGVGLLSQGSQSFGWCLGVSSQEPAHHRGHSDDSARAARWHKCELEAELDAEEIKGWLRPPPPQKKQNKTTKQKKQQSNSNTWKEPKTGSGPKMIPHLSRKRRRASRPHPLKDGVGCLARDGG